ncbi:MAG: IS1 family transposase [Bryobacteraceae bacterium]
MNRLHLANRAHILHLLCEGSSLRVASRIADVSINTVTKLLVDTGTACAEYQDKTLRNLTCKRLQLDEVWSFVYAKAKNVRDAKSAPEIASDVWTWTALDADTKLMASWMVGDRSDATAGVFVDDLASRLANRVQITTDGHRPYVEAIEGAFGADVDYAVLEKIYASAAEGQKRYSPPACVGAKRREVTGQPDQDNISTSDVERANLTMRIGMRRFTRLTNAFSKRVENHTHSISLFAMHYNFARIHKTLRITPTMAAGISDHVWSMEEIARLSN